MTNYTAALQKILDRAGGVVIPKGNHLIDADKGLRLRSGTKLVFAPGARLGSASTIGLVGMSVNGT